MFSSALGNKAKFPFLDQDTGKRYEVGYVTTAVLARFEQAMRSESLRAVSEMKGVVPDDVYTDMLREVSRDIATRSYAYGGELSVRASDTVGGKLLLAELLMWDVQAKRNITRDELLDLVGRRGKEVAVVINAVTAESRPKSAEAASEPGEGAEGNAPGAAGAT